MAFMTSFGEHATHSLSIDLQAIEPRGENQQRKKEILRGRDLALGLGANWTMIHLPIANSV
jgi:hypothetical protein